VVAAALGVPVAVPDALRNVVRTFLAEVDVPSARRTQLARLLSPDETARAGGYRFERHRHRFVVARGLLRGILGRYLDADPRAIRFRYSPNGKPALDADGPAAYPTASAVLGRDPRALTFNVSHSDGLALIAVSCGVRLGVDVERVREDTDIGDLEPLCLAPCETALLAPLQGAARRRAFYQCWTRKEAYLKAIGTGLAVPLQAVGIVPSEDRPGLARVDAAGAGAQWCVHDLVMPSGYCAAVALDDARPIVSRFLGPDEGFG
jgi:4'-phosphopantetheinyl transferase